MNKLYDKKNVSEAELIEILEMGTIEENNAMAFILRQVSNGHTLEQLRKLVDEEFRGKEWDQMEEGLIHLSRSGERRDPEICVGCDHHEKDCHCTAYGYR